MVQGNWRWRQGSAITEEHLLRLQTDPGWHQAAGTASAIRLLPEHNCSCILRHWKLQHNIKSVGLWMAADVVLGT